MLYCFSCPLKPKTAVLTDPSPDILLSLHCNALLTCKTALASFHTTSPALHSDIHTHIHVLQHLSSRPLYDSRCRPGLARSGGSLALDMDSLQVAAAAEANSTGKQDSPRTIMIKANLKKVCLKSFPSISWHLSWSDARGDRPTIEYAAFCISSSALAASTHAVVKSNLKS